MSQQANTTERWLPIPGYEGRYEVSDQGRVRNASSSRVLRQALHKKTGYLSASLSGRRVLAHRLVLLAFAGPCPDGMETRHADGDSENNAIANLSWGTKAQNAIDRVVHGTDPRGERNPRALLCEDDVRAIRSAYVPRVVTHAMLGESYGVSAAAIQAVVTLKTWPHVD